MPHHRPMYRTASNGKRVQIGEYRRFKLTETERDQKASARRVICQMANRIAASSISSRAPFTARQINQAVAVVRHHRAVPPAVLVMAGFLPY